jgi:ATP-dependent Clp endopeptidase proteolytic subunit ClpP|tara:strand:- start:1370 stop:1942 length:573 start_codon:yes stop_codon:yes gene_type:complete
MSDTIDEPEDEVCDVVRVNGCDIYYYGDVDTESTLEFLDAFKKLEVDLLKKAIELPGYKPTIRVHIHSDGGDVFSGLSMMDTLKSSRVNVVTIAEGTCCSAATFILLGGKERLMGKHSFILIHQLSSGFFGKYTELRAEMKTCKKIMSTIKSLYTRETTIPIEKLSQFMKRDIYLGYEECIKYGIVHGHS